jgi:hypothetical protein
MAEGAVRLLAAVLLGLLGCQTNTLGLASGPPDVATTASLDAGATSPDVLAPAAAEAPVAPDALAPGPDAATVSPDVLAQAPEASYDTGRADLLAAAKRDVPPCQPGSYQVVTPYQVPGLDAMEYGYSCAPYTDAGTCVPSTAACTDTLPMGVVTGDTCAAWVKAGMCTATKPEWTTYCDASCGRCKRCE